MHIDKSEDSEEWPFYIEDFHGVTHAVYLTAGDYIMFESTKCLHGRPRVRKGTWYGNVALHFYPKGDWKEKDHALEALYAVPPHWDQQPTTAEHEPLKVGGGMEEVRCDDDWCRTATATKWEGPAKFGYYIDPLNQKHKFEYEHIRAGVDGEL